jgi:HAD superfamily phosphatase
MSELYIRQDLMKILPQVDAVILDIDGVILDVSQSFRQVISQVVQHYALTTLHLEETGVLIETSETEHFKMAGGFNNDWDLANAAVALVVAKKAASSARDTLAIRALSPDWETYCAEIKKRGGGPVAAEKYILDMLTPQQRRDFSLEWNSRLVVRLCQEMYGGEDACKALYGFDPEYLHVEGLYKQEAVLLDKKQLPPVPIGILTGRTLSESRLAMSFAQLEREIPEVNWVTDSDGIHKPDGRTLLLCQEKMKFKTALYIGDTKDDWDTVVSYREQKSSGRARVFGGIVLSGPSGEANRRAFLEAGTEIIAPDANAVLGYLKHVLKKS